MGKLAIIPVFFLAASLHGTVVTGTIRKPDLSLASGRAYIDLTGTCIGSGGAVIVNPTKIVTFTAGAFSADLEPSSTCTPSQVYRVRYQIDGWNAPLQFWNVTGTAPTTIQAVQVPGVPVSGGALAIGYLTGGACKGDLFAYTGSTFTRVPCGPEGYILKRRDAQANGVTWEPDAGGGSTYGRYSATISPASTTWTIAGGTHGLGSCALAYAFWVSNVVVEPATISCNASTFDVTITWASAQTGDVYFTSDPVWVADNLTNGSLVSQIVTQAYSAASSITITHSLNAVVIVRCYQQNGLRAYYDTATRLSANALTVTFTGSPTGFCVVGR